MTSKLYGAFPAFSFLFLIFVSIIKDTGKVEYNVLDSKYSLKRGIESTLDLIQTWFEHALVIVSVTLIFKFIMCL